MSKLTMHCQQVPGWVQAWVESTGAGWVKGIDNFPHIPGVKTIGRTYMPDNESNQLVWQGAVGAEQWFYRWLPVYRANPHVWCWEGPNEPQPMWDPAFRRAADDFTVRLVQLMSAEGLRLVGHNWSVGWPDVGHAPEFRNSINALAQGGHYLGVHEYAAPAVWDGDGWLTMRFPKTIQELVSAGVMIPSVLITECGIDGGVIGQPRTGWKTFASEDGYVDQLVWYESQLQQYPYVEAATTFTAGPYGDWLDFEVTESLAWKLADALGSITPPPPPPTPDYALGIDVSDHQGVIDWDMVAGAEIDGKPIDFVMVRASVCRSDGSVVKDSEFDRNWAEAKRVGMLRGAYHYLGIEGWGQAKFFVETVGDDLPELGYYGDLEHGGLDSARCQRFLEAVNRNLYEIHGILDGCDVYSRASFLNSFGIPLPWAYDRYLWVASPGQPEPVMPDAWADWEFWQFGQRQVPGIDTGLVDVNYFNGTQLELYAKYGKEPPPVTTDVEFIWYDGTKVDEATFREEFGDFQIVRDPNAKYKIVRLKAVASSQSFWFYLLDNDGNPMPENSEGVVLSWPTAPELPMGGWDKKGIVAPLKANGGAEHIMGSGAKYWPPEGGPHSAWVYGQGQSDKFANFGWLGGTQYNHIDVAAKEAGSTPTQYYYLYYSAEPEEAGYVVAVPEPVNDMLPEGTMVTLTAFAHPGWTFSHWSIPDAPKWSVTVEMNQDLAIAAHFVEDTGEIDIPAAIEDGYMAIEHIHDALRHLGEDV